MQSQCVKKVISNNLQLLDFAIWLMHRSQHFLYLHQTKTFPKLFCTFCLNSQAWLILLKIASAKKSTFHFLDAILERPGNNNTLYATTVQPTYNNLPFIFNTT